MLVLLFLVAGEDDTASPLSLVTSGAEVATMLGTVEGPGAFRLRPLDGEAGGGGSGAKATCCGCGASGKGPPTPVGMGSGCC